MLGDHDFVSVDHALELFRLVPDGSLAVLPGTDHSGPVTRSDWLVSMLLDFFEQ